MPSPIPLRELIQRLKTFGFEGRSQVDIRSCDAGTFKRHSPNERGGDISGNLVARILRTAGLRSEEWDRRE